MPSEYERVVEAQRRLQQQAEQDTFDEVAFRQSVRAMITEVDRTVAHGTRGRVLRFHRREEEIDQCPS